MFVQISVFKIPLFLTTNTNPSSPSNPTFKNKTENVSFATSFDRIFA